MAAAAKSPISSYGGIAEGVTHRRGFAPWNLTIASAEYMTDIDATFWAMTRTAAMVIFILMLLSAAIAWAITKSVVTPLSVLKARMAGLSASELHAPVSATDRPDEIGEMARTVQVFKSAMIETERMRAEQLELEKRQDQRRRADMSQLADGFEGAVGAATQRISSNIQRAAGGTSQVASNITDVQRGASETGSASTQVLTAAKSLSNESNRLKLEVGKFMNLVRAA
jgi:methyl-accepting chemotaxis protein